MLLSRCLILSTACPQLQGKTDQKFVENSFRLFRDCFNIKTVLTPANFLEQVSLLPAHKKYRAPWPPFLLHTCAMQGFAERKLLLVSDVIQACKKIHNDEIRKERLAALKHRQGPGVESRLYQPTHKTPEVKVMILACSVKCYLLQLCVCQGLLSRASWSLLHNVCAS